MEEKHNYFEIDRILIDLEAENSDRFLENIADFLFDKGIVTSDFKQGILEREKKFPTGLPTVPFHVAIPHSDMCYVLKDAITIVRFKDSVKFKEMGSLDKWVDAQFAFVLSLKSKSHTEMLQKLMNLFMNEEIMNALQEAVNEKQIFEIIVKYMNEG